MPLIKEIRALGASRSQTGAGRHRGDGEWRLIVLDNGRRLRVDVEQVARHGLAPGEAIELGVLTRLTAHDAQLRARESALRLLAGRPRSAAEVGERLARGRVPKATIQAVIAGLAADGLLDDLAFARAWIARRASQSQYGLRRIRWELRRKGVPAATIERALDESRADDPATPRDEDQLAAALIRNSARRYQSLPPERRARRVAALLERHGFAPGTIVRALRSFGSAATVEELDA
jgi:regulatory protein